MAAVFTTGLNCAWDAIRSNAIRLILIFWFVMDTVHWAEKLFTVVFTNHQLSPFKWKRAALIYCWYLYVKVTQSVPICWWLSMLENCVTQNEKKTKYSQSLKNRGNEKGDHLQTPARISLQTHTPLLVQQHQSNSPLWHNSRSKSQQNTTNALQCNSG